MFTGTHFSSVFPSGDRSVNQEVSLFRSRVQRLHHLTFVAFSCVIHLQKRLFLSPRTSELPKPILFCAGKQAYFSIAITPVEPIDPTEIQTDLQIFHPYKAIV